MKKQSFIYSILLAGSLLAADLQAAAEARITSIQVLKTNIVVEVQASGDLVKVLLESSTRVGRRVWEPRAIRHLEPAADARNLIFSLPITPEMEILRVRAESNPALPASFYSGTNEFLAATGQNSIATGAGPGVGAPADNSFAERGGEGGGDRAVVESDIYNLSGDTLFFFNQYRGLQVIDVSDPDEPNVTGSYDMAAAGEQMYLMGGNRVVLLARDNCSWYGGSTESKVVLLEVIDGVPHLVKELPVPGYIMESRLVGTGLYVVANSYQRTVVGAGENWVWGSELTSFDLSDFDTAAQKSSEWIEGYGNVIYATDQYLFVAHSTYENQSYSSRIHVHDISDPSGTIEPQSVITVAGNVEDKFKMNLNGDVFTVVTFDWSNNRPTVVRTFSLSDPENPAALGSLKIIENERLHATRFHGNTLYAVTFFMIDPLWIIDLSNPAAPKRTGELEIPGWSTYLQPLGDKLLAIGIEQNNGTQRTMVQLFDVSDPTAPFLASKVFIGDQWSGSEANWDEKAFGVLPDENLLLVPFYSYGENGSTHGVQLIDLLSDSLVKRGIIEQEFGARRAAVHKNRILSLSTRELLTVDATDRDNPDITARTVLSWAADQLHLAGDYLIEVDAAAAAPLLRIVSAENPGELLNTVALTDLPYLGSTVKDGKLYVLQGHSRQLVWPTVYDPDNWRPTATNEGVLVCTEFPLDSLPSLTASNSARTGTSMEVYFGQLKALSVKDDLIVWASSSQGGYPWWRWGYDVLALGGAAEVGMTADFAAPGRGMALWYGGGSGTFISVKTGSDFSFGAEVQITSENQAWWNYGDSFTAEGLVYTSHLASEFDPTFDPPPYSYQTYQDGKLVNVTVDPPPGEWVQRYYLDVIDFNDPDEPLVRKPVNIPGSLVGLDRGGELLYTKGQIFQYRTYDGTETLSAVAYDGVEASLVDSIKLALEWPKPVLVHDGSVYVGQAPSASNDQKSSIDVWTVPATGKFTLLDTVPVAEPVQQFASFGDLLAAQSSTILLFDASDPASLNPVGSGTASTCYGVTLTKGDGALGRGLWVPMGWYGVVKVPAEPPTQD